MAQTVRCDVCGKLFNTSYLGAHKRLAHAKEKGANEQIAVEKILKLFEGLSPEGKKKALEQLTGKKSS